jgi:hypothetical protein
VRHARDPEVVSLVCRNCGVSFERKARWERHNRKQNKVGPFCGKSCAARWSIYNSDRPPTQRGRKPKIL